MSRFDTEAFIDGYIEAALWADAWPLNMDDNTSTGGLNGTHEIDAAGRAKMTPDCERFIEENRADLEHYIEEIRPIIDGHGGSDDRRPEAWAGHDFWLTRGGHGTGFWDRGLGKLGESLSEAAKAYGEPDGHTPYAIDDHTATA